MQITDHAKKRWEERFNRLDIHEQFERATCRIGSKLRKKILKKCPGHQEKQQDRIMRRTPDGIVFILAGDDTIITVLDFRDFGDTRKIPHKRRTKK